MTELPPRTDRYARRIVRHFVALSVVLAALLGAGASGAYGLTPATAATASVSSGPLAAEAETEPTREPDPAAQAAAVTRLTVTAAFFAIIFIGIGIAFFRMLRHARLD